MPERLAGYVPPLLVEIAVGLVVAAICVGIRWMFIPVAADRAPYAFNFLGVVVAAVIAGWRGGLITLLVAQLVTFYVIVEPHWGFAPPGSDRFAGMLIAMAAEAMILLVISMYQREVAKGVEEREKRMDLLGRALEEIDHRTRNNYQTVLALVQLQAQRSKDEGVQTALQQVADRIKAVTKATERLGHRSKDIGTVGLREHLCELCEQVERGLSRDGVKVKCEIDDLAASAEKAIYLAIIVNELVTNALKHAFDDGKEGVIRVASEQKGQSVTIIVEDNGNGYKAASSKVGTGLGTKLVDRFARELGCQHEVVSSTNGTTHRLQIASLV